jgi:Reverse transcriptase (RNA-dependent DNA polymerase)
VNPVPDDEGEEPPDDPAGPEEELHEDSDEENQIVGPIPTVNRRISGVNRELRNLTTSYNPFPLGTNREVRNLTTSYNPDPVAHAETAMLARMFETSMLAKMFETAMVSTIHNGNPEPKTYKEAKQSIDWDAWWKAMCTEFFNMEDKKVWEIKQKKDLPAGRKLIGNRWVYAQKDDGRYRARTVAKGFSQVPGKDFQENHAPVVNDTTFHLMLVLKVLLNLYAGQFDIETAFLYGDLEEELWMQLPEGYCEYVLETYGLVISPETHCLLLLKALYGLVQAARQWWKKFKTVMKSIGYTPSPADPCLFLKQSKDQSKNAFVIIYVDDGGIFGTKENIDELVKALGKDFKVKYLGKLEHFVGCHIIENKAKDTLWIHQPKLIKHLKQEFGEMIHTTRVYATPAGPKTMCMRPQEGDNLITTEDQSKFRSGVGMLLYLVKHSRPDIANAVRELSKVADGATPGHWKAMIRLIKYVIDTEHYGLKIKPKRQDELFHLEGISDSEYAGDKETRISVYGYILYFCGAPISWKSKAGKSVTLSSTEAEYFAASEIAKEVIYTKQLAETMGLKIKLPIIIRVDNVGAIYIANNHTIGQRTKHIDIRAHFVREFIEDGILKIVFIKSEDNDADIFTKNTTEDLFIKHSSKNVEEVNKEGYK